MTIVWAGLATGSLYALVGVGYSITLGQSGVFNFAQAPLMVLSAFFAWFTMAELGWPWWLAAAVGAIAGALLAMLQELVTVRPLINRRKGHELLVTTVGAVVLIEGMLYATWGRTPHSLPFFGGTEPLTLLGGRLNVVDLWLIGLAVFATLSLHVVSRRTVWGVAGRAATEDADVARVRGVNVTALRLSAFALTGAFAGILGPVLAPKIGVTVGVTTSMIVFGFVVITLGGHGSYLGCLVGGFTVGLMQAFGARYFGVEYPPIILFAVLLSVLLLKPTGLFGQRVLRAV